MVIKLFYVLVFSIFFLEYIHFGLGLGPRLITWVPELLSLAASLLIILLFATKKMFNLPRRYLGLLLVLLLVVACGVVLQGGSIERFVLGLRVYLKHLPFFFLPAVFDFSEQQYKRILAIYAGLLVLQLPVALFQRLVQFRGIITGDVITGTVNGSGTLSIILICGIAVALGCYLKGKLSLKLFLILSLIFFIPTTINETKATLVFLPLVLILPVLLNNVSLSTQLRYFAVISIVLVLGITIFFPTYNYFMKDRLSDGVVSHFLQKGELERYLYKGVEGHEWQDLRRGDRIVLAFKHLRKESGSLLFGLGTGNVIHTSFGKLSDFQEDIQRYHPESLGITMYLWELGVVGVFVHLLLYLSVFLDALALRKRPGLFGGLALSWVGVVVVMLLCLLYTNILHRNVINYSFWFLCGLIAAKAHQHRVQQHRMAFSSVGRPVDIA